MNDAVAALRAASSSDQAAAPRSRRVNAGQISKDHHSARSSSARRAPTTDAVTYIDTITAATEKVQDENPGYYVGQAGSASTGKALDDMFQGQLAMAGLLSIPLTLGILLLVFGSLVGASIPLLLALTSVFATMGLVALPSQIVPMDESISEVILLIGLAVGVDYSLSTSAASVTSDGLVAASRRRSRPRQRRPAGQC